jgi:hypothetical protein
MEGACSVGREEGRGGGREVRNSCRKEWKGNHVAIRKMFVKKHSEPSCEMGSMHS